MADSALYTADNLLVIEHLKWITRVPLSIKAAQFYVRETSDSEISEENIIILALQPMFTKYLLTEQFAVDAQAP